MLNNVEDTRVGTLFMDVDYSSFLTGTNAPVNFDLIISGSALKFPIPDSNYTTRRHREPRYDGVKNTSNRTNKWEESGSLGNYGKTPSISDLRTAVAYCESIPSSVPEKMDASTAFVKYLINQDGTVSTPNVTPDSLQLNQGNFQTGERVFLATQNEIEQNTFQGSDYNTNYREIVRGATRIEPILHNQSGSLPARWVNTIEFENRSAAAVGNYTFTSPIIIENYEPTPSTYTPSTFNNYSFPDTAYLEGVKVQITASVTLVRLSEGGDITDGDIGLYLYDATTSTYIYDESFPNFTTDTNPQTYTLRLELTPGNMNALSNKNLQIKLWYRLDSNTGPDYRMSGGTLTVNQYPSPGNQPSILITSSIWDYGAVNQIATTPQSQILSDIFRTNLTSSDWYFKGIPNSDYSDILTPWNIQRGDEFRFEGNVNKVYLVDSVDISNPDYLFINFAPDVDLSTTDINKYSITRYVDDASKIIIKGFRPNNTTGPYILRPEFVVPELDKGIDEFIVDLTQKGLL
jgi:hypothetical protein